jgi:hypothetical protein
VIIVARKRERKERERVFTDLESDTSWNAMAEAS